MSAAVLSRATPARRVFDAALLLALASLTAALVWAVATQPRLLWVDVIYDDAYYYLGVARNMALSGTSSFLPPFETNGYQPLWLLLLSAAAWLFGAGDRALPIEMICLSMVFMLLFALAAGRLHGRLWPALWVSAGFPAVMTWGLETVMMPLWVLLYFRAQRWPAKGTLASAIFLTRLDGLAFIVIVDAYDLLVGRRRLVDLKHWLVLAPVIGAYFYVNWAVFGIPVPVSGLAKAVGNVPGENLLPLAMFAVAGRAVVPLALLWIALGLGGKTVLRHQREVVVLLATCAATIGYYTLLSGWAVWGWYFWPLMLLAYYVTLECLGAWRDRSAFAGSRLAGAALLLLALALFLDLSRTAAGTASRFARLAREVAHQHVELWSFGRKNSQLVDEIRTGRMAPGNAFAMGDRAGSFGFFIGNGYRFVHTEGLVGPYGYVRALRAGQAAEFVEKLAPDFLVVDRESFTENDSVLVVTEPVQGWSVRTGPFALCFSKDAVLSRDGYLDQTRLVIDFHRRVACPQEVEAARRSMQARYGALRRSAFPSEYKDKTGLAGLLTQP